MKNTALPIILTILLLLLLPLSVKAEAELSIAPSLLHFDYTEFGFNNSELNNETGTILGTQLDLNTTINEKLSIEFEISHYDGNVNYDGRSQSGVAITTATNENVFRYGVKIITSLIYNTDIFLSTTFHQWDRDIQGKDTILGIFEKYQWREISAGIKTKLWSTKQSSWFAEAAILKTINPEMHIDLSEADFGSTNLKLGTDTGARFQLSWVKSDTNKRSYGINAFYETWDFGISDSNTTSGGTTSISIYEPRSETRHSGIQFLLSFHY